MVQRPIPRTGELLPVVGLGTWQSFDVAPAAYPARAAVLRRFAELGGRVVDTSPMYGRSERTVGDLASRLARPGAIFMATKVWTRGDQEGRTQMEESFAHLRVARVDLMQVHNLVDVETHLATLAEWKAAGRVRYVGVTHYTVEAQARLEPFLRRGAVDFVQFNYSLAIRDAERRLLPMAAEHGVATLVNRPFESGGMFARVKCAPLPEVARDLGCVSWAQLFLKYVVSHPAVTCVIPATTGLRHLEENMGAGDEPVADAATRARMVQAWESISGG